VWRAPVFCDLRDQALMQQASITVTAWKATNEEEQSYAENI